MRFIPLVAAALGAALGVVAYFAVPSIVPAENVFVAILIGIASGLTATGTNQIIKQLGKKDDGNGDFAKAYADAIIERLWIKGLITEEERDRLYEKNPYKNL